MKRIIYILLSIVILGSCAKAPAGEDGKDGIDGKDGRDGNTMMAGTGVPLPNIGREGDFYLNLSTIEIYGPKTANGWGTPFSLKGLKGEKGDDGDKGATGDTGPRGIDGTNGTDGTKVLSGNGDPSTSIGKIGDFYLDLQNRRLYGPKTNSGWGNGYNLAIRRFKLEKTDISITLTRGGQIKITSGNGNYQITQDQSSQEIVEVTLVSSNNLIELKGKKAGLAKFTITDTYINKSIVVSVVVQQLANINDYDYELSADKRTLIKWFSDVTGKHIDMQNHYELRHVQHIGQRVFHEKNLVGITLPDGLQSIGDSAFLWCRNLTSITIPQGVTTIEEDAFRGCQSLTSITIPNSVTIIQRSVFTDSGLTSVTIPNSVTSIRDWAFDNCKLTSIDIPNSVTSIGKYAFRLNPLTSITIPDGVTTIEQGVFEGCSALTTVVLGSGIQHITRQAFLGYSGVLFKNSNIHTLTINATTPPTFDFKEYTNPPFYVGNYRYYSSPFVRVYSTATWTEDQLRSISGSVDAIGIANIYVPAQSVDTYKNHPHWKMYAHIIKPI